MPESDDLFLQASTGDIAALEAFFDLHGGPILAAVRHSMNLELRSGWDSVDFMQEARLKLLQSNIAERHFETPQKLIAYMVCIARNEVRHAKRELARRHTEADKPLDALSAEQLEDRAPQPPERARWKEEWANALDELPPADQEIMILKANGCTHGRGKGVGSNSVRHSIYPIV